MKPLSPVRPRMPAEMPAMDASDVRLKGRFSHDTLIKNELGINGNRNTVL